MKAKDIILIISIIIFSFNSLALGITWLGTSCVLLEGENESILFDPFLTRPSKTDLVLFRKLKSSSVIVEKWLPLNKRKKIKGIFISHSHYDHVLDIGEVHRGSSSKVYGSSSALIISEASGVDKKYLIKSSVKDIFQIGDFKVEILKGAHLSHMFGITLASGKVADDFSYPTSAYQYKMGENFSYLIEYKGKTILFNAATSPALNKMTSIDLMIQGLARKKGYQKLIEQEVIPSGASVIIPIHHDDFFKPLGGGMEILGFADLGYFRELLGDKSELKTIDYGERLDLFINL